MTEPTADPQTKICPQCAEEVKVAARICRFCRYEFVPLDPVPATAPPDAQPADAPPGNPDGPVRQSRADLTVELAAVTREWTEPVVVRQFEASRAGQIMIGDAAGVMWEHGYEPESPVYDGQSAMNVTYARRPDQPAAAKGPLGSEPIRAPKAARAPKPAKGPTPEAGAGDGTKQALIGLIMLGGLALGGAGFFQSPGVNWLMVGGGVVVLVVGVVLMTAAFPNGMPDTSPERAELKRITGNWTVPFLVRSYKNDDSGRGLASKEAGYLTQHGYVLAGQSGTGSHVNVGRTASRVVLTGGIGLLFGASRSKGTIDITFVRQ